MILQQCGELAEPGCGGLGGGGVDGAQGQTVPIASDRPLGLSQPAMRTSSTPRFLSSVSTPSSALPPSA